MVDLGEGQTGIRWGDPGGQEYASVEGCADARSLAALSTWPRIVTVFEDNPPVLVEGVDVVGDDPPGVVRLRLRGSYRGYRVVGVIGELPLPADPWWTGYSAAVPLYGRERDVREAVERGGLSPAEPRGNGPREVRRVRMLGGPMDGDDLETNCGEVECLGVLDRVAGRWRKPGEGSGGHLVTHVWYRVRRAADLDATGPWWDESTLANHEWVATFEGARRLGDMLADDARETDARPGEPTWPERLGPGNDRLLEGPQPGEHEHARFRTCHPGCPLYAQPVPDRDTWERVSGGRRRVRDLAAAEFRLALEQQALVEELGAQIRELRRRQQAHIERRDVHYEVLHAGLRMSDEESRKALAWQVAADGDADGVHLLRTVWLPKEYETWEREQS